MTSKKRADKVDKAPGPEAPVLVLMKELENLQDLQDELKLYLAEECAEEIAAIAEIQARIAELQAKEEVFRASMRERASHTHDDLARVAQDISNKEDAIKRLCYTLPPRALAKGVSLSEGKIRVKVNKASLLRTYTAKLLEDHPEFYTMRLGDEPLVRHVLNDVLLERMVAQGMIAEATIAPYRIEAAAKNPGVRVTREQDTVI